MRKKVRTPRSGYSVGYGRPPTSSQFKPGQSGNPAGRPRGARNASSLAREALERPINVKVKGTSRKMSVRKAAYRRLAEKAVAGDVKALDYLLSLERAELPTGPDHAQSEPLSAKDVELLQRFFDRRRAGAPEQVQPHARRQQPPNPEKDSK
jgi:hypothetical protein